MQPSTKIEFPTDICPLCERKLIYNNNGDIDQFYCHNAFHYIVTINKECWSQAVYVGKFYIKSDSDLCSSKIFTQSPTSFVVEVPIIKIEQLDKMETRLNNLLLFL